MAKLTGEVKYCFHIKPHTQFKPHKFKVDLMLDKDEEKKAKELGLNVKPKNDSHPKPFVAFTSYVDNDEHLEFVGDSENGRRPKAFDAEGNPLKGAIGDGSIASVVFRVWDHSNGKKALWRAIQVHELKLPEGFDENYSGGDDDFMDEIEVAKPSAKKSKQDDDDEVDPELNDSLDDL